MTRPIATPAATALRRTDAWWLAAIVYAALLVRGWVPYGNVFGGGGVAFQSTDSWYHLRLIDHLVANFPHRMRFDPYALHPGGAEIGVAPLFDYLVAVVALAAGLGSPSPATVERVAAWLPPVLAALAVLAVYGLGRRAFDRRTGLLAAAILAIQPGQFMLRSLLGFADHHVAEALFSTVTAWLLVVALDHTRAQWEAGGADGGGGAAAGAGGARTANPAAAARNGEPGARLGWSGLVAAVLAGVALAAYLGSWGGGALFVAVLGLWVAVQRSIDHLLGRQGLYLVRAVTPAALAALAVLAPFAGALHRFEIHAAALAGLAAAPAALEALSRLAARVKLPRALFPAAAAALAGAGWLGLRLAWPEAADAAARQLARLGSPQLARTVAEARPLLAGPAAEAWAEVWIQYRLALALGVTGLAVLAWRTVRGRARPEHVLIVVWALAMLAATLMQNRFGYYLDVVLALLVGLLCATVLGHRRRVPVSVEGASTGPWWMRGRVRVPMAAVLAAAILLPTLRPVLALARTQRAPSPEWRAALEWLRRETPEPFGDSGAYLARYPRRDPGAGLDRRPPPAEQERTVPAAAYGVLAWWDYGYWIVRLGRRVPTANPTQAGAATAARFLTATDEAEALAVLDRAGARYVVANAELALRPAGAGGASGLFGQLAPWAGEPLARYLEVYHEPAGPGGAREPSLFFYPAYYRAMAVRLLLGGGERVEGAGESWAISWEARPGPGGEPVKAVTAARRFERWDEARGFLDSRPAGERWRLACRDPRVSCAPLPALEGLARVHPAGDLGPGVPAVVVFERRP